MGQQLRVGVVLLFPDAQSMPASAAAYSAGGGRVVWERPSVRFSEALCSLGLVRYVDMYGGTDDDGRGDWLEWDQFYHLMEAAAWQHSP